ncbi:hypothetical protein EDC59_1011 [Pseudodesulfovibrio indicus]|uniref:Uncharacterized protein n=1 Tax=Pseudodesulfovibrio indicus TaxID=1716143 RepID=A0AA94PQB2_9BACT|nr:hypothetical protein EDC59_1011 [Pseudodesulfovibrio indicus]
MPSGQRKALTGSWPLFPRSRTAAHFLLTFWGASQKVRRCKSAKRSPATDKTPDADARTSLPRSSLFPCTRKRIPHTPHAKIRSLPAPRLFHHPSQARTIPARRAVIRKPGPRACLKRRSGARLSLPRQTCRQGSERRLQALGHCFRAPAPQAHFLLTFWGASQKVRRCKSAKRSLATGKTPDADARTTLPRSSLSFPSPLRAPPPTAMRRRAGNGCRRIPGWDRKKRAGNTGPRRRCRAGRSGGLWPGKAGQRGSG